jgi:hypothetical protein
MDGSIDIPKLIGRRGRGNRCEADSSGKFRAINSSWINLESTGVNYNLNIFAGNFSVYSHRLNGRLESNSNLVGDYRSLVE